MLRKGLHRILMAGLVTASVLAGGVMAVDRSGPTLEYDFVDSYLDYRVYDLPAEVVFTQRFEGWQEGDQQGLYRLVITDAGEHHLMYIQWVCRCEEGVVSVIPISELNRDGPFIYTPPDMSQRGQTTYVELVARNTRTDEHSLVRVFLPQIGRYRIEYDTWSP